MFIPSQTTRVLFVQKLRSLDLLFRLGRIENFVALFDLQFLKLEANFDIKMLILAQFEEGYHSISVFSLVLELHIVTHLSREFSYLDLILISKWSILTVHENFVI